MRNVIVTVMSSLFLILVMSGIFAERAQAGKMVLGCSLAIAKDAGETDTVFNFLVDPSGGDEFELPVASGDDKFFELEAGESAIVSELVPDGWTLVDVDCVFEGGTSLIVDEANNVFFSCLSAGVAGCTFTNRNTGAIPTLSEWGMIAAAAGLALVGVYFAVRRRRAVGV